MAETLFLTENEREIFGDLPAAVTDSMKDHVMAEDIEDAIETKRQLSVRRALVRKQFPELAVFVDEVTKHMKTGQITPPDIIENMNDDAFVALTFAAGVVCLSAYIELCLASAQSAEELQQLTHITAMRRWLAGANRGAHVS